LFLNGRFLLIDFAGHVRSETSEFNFEASSFGPDGTRVVGLAGGVLTVLDRSLQVLWQRPSPVRGVLNLSLAPDSSEIAVVELGRNRLRRSLWLVKRSGAQRLVHEFNDDETGQGSSSIGWSPDGRSVAFGAGGQIRILDLDTGIARRIAAGTEPAWSPDGRWVAYRDEKGLGRLITPAGDGDKLFGQGKTIVSGAHWAPDSRYVLVQEEHGTRDQSPACGSDELVAYSVADNARVEVYDTCGLRDWYFGWVAGPAEWLRSFRSSR
jgi:dipeptidyl aminopeptidase/acylaminoacyl peptidase